MHAIIPLLEIMSSSNKEQSNTSTTSEEMEDQNTTKQQQQQQQSEIDAVDRAKASADAAYRPSPAVFNSQNATILLQQVDGPSLVTYESTESVYVGRAVPIAAGGKLNIPINVSTPGSVVEYAIELQYYDIDFAISAERDEGITIVKEKGRLYSDSSPVTQKFLVATVPCLIQFDFSNEYSWVREKIISYKITVSPPTKESLVLGRRRRAASCLKAVVDDLHTASTRLDAATVQKNTIAIEVSKLQKELEEKKKLLAISEKEEAWLTERKTLRVEQQKLLQQRLTNGWDDETDLNLASSSNNNTTTTTTF